MSHPPRPPCRPHPVSLAIDFGLVHIPRHPSPSRCRRPPPSFSPSSPRRLTFSPGPLESRRRLGKRHMTRHMPAPPSFPIIWQFALPPTLPPLPHWEPPTAASLRRRTEHGDHQSHRGLLGLLNNLLSRLSQPDAAPNSAATHDIDAVPKQPSQSELQSSAPAALHHHLPAEILQLQSTLLQLDRVELHALSSLCRPCRRHLRRRIELGQLSAAALVASLDPLTSADNQEALTAKISPLAASKMAAMIRRTILFAMADAQKADPNIVPPSLWAAFAEAICRSGGQNHNMNLFWRLMAAMPTPVRHQIPRHRLSNLARAFITALAARSPWHPRWSSQMARFGSSLQRLSTPQRRHLDDAIRRFTLGPGLDPDAARRLRYCWLLAKAYDASTTKQQFHQLCQWYHQPGLLLSRMQLWQILAARLVAAGVIDSRRHKSLMAAEYESMDQRWAALMQTLLLSSLRPQALHQLCDSLSALREPCPAAASRGIVAAAQAMAAACDDHHQALAIHQSVALPDAPPPSWHWRAWEKHVEGIIKDPRLDPRLPWQLLRLAPPRHPASGEVEAMMGLLDRMASWLLEASHLSDRQTLLQLERCLARQRSLVQTPSSHLLAALTELLTRDLQQGRPGRSARFRWLFNLLSHAKGRDEARRAAVALMHWRGIIHRASGPWPRRQDAAVAPSSSEADAAKNDD